MVQCLEPSGFYASHHQLFFSESPTLITMYPLHPYFAPLPQPPPLLINPYAGRTFLSERTNRIPWSPKLHTLSVALHRSNSIDWTKFNAVRADSLKHFFIPFGMTEKPSLCQVFLRFPEWRNFQQHSTGMVYLGLFKSLRQTEKIEKSIRANNTSTRAPILMPTAWKHRGVITKKSFPVSQDPGNLN